MQHGRADAYIFITCCVVEEVNAEIVRCGCRRVRRLRRYFRDRTPIVCIGLGQNARWKEADKGYNSILTAICRSPKMHYCCRRSLLRHYCVLCVYYVAHVWGRLGRPGALACQHHHCRTCDWSLNTNYVCTRIMLQNCLVSRLSRPYLLYCEVTYWILGMAIGSATFQSTTIAYIP